MLICTSLTRKCRHSIFKALHTDKGYLAFGPAGSGKTETYKDTMKLLGRDTLVLNCSDHMTATEPNWDKHVQEITIQNGTRAPICLDEVNRVPTDIIPQISQKLDNVFVAYTMNPNYEGRYDFPETIKATCEVVEMSIPDFVDILEVLFAFAGLTDLTIAKSYIACKEELQSTIVKQPWYDWGLRFDKRVTQFVQLMCNKHGWGNQRQNVSDSLCRMFNAWMVKEDLQLAFDIVVKHFGPTNTKISNDFLESAKDASSVTHGILINGDFTADEVTSILRNIDEMNGAKSWTVEAADADVLYGKMVDGHWVDGTFTLALREAGKASGPVHIYVVGEMGPARFESLNTVTDGNKMLTLCTGERLRLPIQGKVWFICKNPEWSPAAFSRVAPVLVRKD